MKRINKKTHTDHHFNDPQKGFDATSKRIVFSLLIVIVAVIIGTYFYINYKYGSLMNMFIGETTETTVEESTEEIEIVDVDGKKNYLIAVTSPGESEIYNIFMVGINMTDNKAAIVSLPIYTLDAGKKTLEQEFKLGGISQVEYVLERWLEIDFDAVLCATQNGYKFFLTELGKGIDYTIPEDLQFSTTTYTVSLSEGEQFIAFDTFVKLLRYDAWKGGTEVSYQRQAELIKALFEQYFKLKYITSDVDKHTYRMKYIKTDSSSEDYVNDLQALRYIAATDFSVRVITPQGKFQTASGAPRFQANASFLQQIKSGFTLEQTPAE